MGEAPRYAEGLYELARDTHAWLVPNGSWGETNLGLVRCGDETVLIDTCWDLRFTREMLRHAEPVLREAPITRVINTHADGDHCWGNQLFADNPILATRACVGQMGHHPPGQLRALQWGSKLFRCVPAAGVDELGRYMGDMLRPYRFGDVKLTPATQTFEGETKLEIGGTVLHLVEVGPGHTDGDCIVHLPERGVVFTGDILFVGVTPVAWAGPVSRIVESLKLVLAMAPRVIVPGHGPLAGVADLHAQIAYWEWVQARLEPLARQGLPPEQACRRLLEGADFRSQPFAAWLAPERLFTSACTLYREWGLPAGGLPGPLGALDHFRRQARLTRLAF